MSLGSILGKIAPELEAGLDLVGGPFGAIGALAVKAVSSVVSPDNPDATPETLLASMQTATPDQLIQLQKFNNDFKLQTAQLNLDVLQLKEEQDASDAADRQSARNMATVRGFWPQVCISAGFLLGYFSLLVIMLLGIINVPDKYHDLVVALFGVITAAVPQILNFWFGSTHGSQKKDRALTQAALSD